MEFVKSRQLISAERDIEVKQINAYQETEEWGKHGYESRYQAEYF